MSIFVRTSSSEYAIRNCPIEHSKRKTRSEQCYPATFVLQQQEDGHVEVSAIDPVASMQAITHVTVDQIAQEMRSHLQHVIDEVGNATESAGAS